MVEGKEVLDRRKDSRVKTNKDIFLSINGVGIVVAKVKNFSEYGLCLEILWSLYKESNKVCISLDSKKWFEARVIWKKINPPYVTLGIKFSSQITQLEKIKMKKFFMQPIVEKKYD